MRKRVLHPTVFLKNRNHEIDLYVLFPCSMLWQNGIKTYYSCQGGPGIINGKIVSERAYVVVEKKDAKKTCKILKDLNPKIKGPLLHGRVSIKFDACEEAKNIPLIIEQTKIKYVFDS